MTDQSARDGALKELKKLRFKYVDGPIPHSPQSFERETWLCQAVGALNMFIERHISSLCSGDEKAVPQAAASGEGGKQELLHFINETPLMQSLLYDLDLMPEQLTENSPRWETVAIIAGHLKEALSRPPASPTAGSETLLLHEKVAPRWVTSWPEWHGIHDNVTVVPAEDYDHLLKQLATLQGAHDADGSQRESHSALKPPDTSNRQPLASRSEPTAEAVSKPTKWNHGCNMMGMNIDLWLPACPQCGMPRPDAIKGAV